MTNDRIQKWLAAFGMSGADECPGCGSSQADRAKRDDCQELRECPHCGALKCAMCDMGDDVECPGCGDVEAA